MLKNYFLIFPLLLFSGSAAFGMIVSGDSLYMIEKKHGVMVIIDISEPELPELVGSPVEVPGEASNVDVEDGIAYVTNSKGLQIIDISQKPPVLGSLIEAHFGEASDIDVKDGIACVANGYEGLQIIDLNQKPPKSVGTVAISDYAGAVDVKDGIAYVTAWKAGLQVINIGDSKPPSIIASIKTPGEASDVDVKNGIAYVADRNSGVQTIDIRNLNKLINVSPAASIVEIESPDYVRRLAVSDNFDYVVAAKNSGLQISDRRNAKKVVNYDTLGVPLEIAVSDNQIYMVNEKGLLNIRPLS